MARVVVVGGGFAGLSAAARLAKLRHDVTVVEESAALGGRMRGVEFDGHRFDLTSPLVTLPGVFRDLFRKSGRPMDRILGFEKVHGRRHLFTDASVLDLPLGNRGDQVRALEEWAPETAGWSTWVDKSADTWDALRTVSLDHVFTGREAFTSSQWKTLRVRRSVAKELSRARLDERMGRVITDPLALDGHDPKRVPAFVASSHYVERNFGLWAFDGGMPGLISAMEQRLDERSVTIVLDCKAHDVVLRDGDVAGVVVGADVIPADIVVWCAPTWPVSLRAPQAKAAIPASRAFLTLAPSAPALAIETHAHADAPLRLFANDPTHVTVEHRGSKDPLQTLAHCGLDLRPHVVARHDVGPAELDALGHWGWQWQRWTSACAAPGVNPGGSLYFAGAHAHPGPTLELIGMATAAIAEAVGKS
ncbi:MAG: UDP-galactopyranose mutase [Nocardioidaceae bacterium]|nr:UDP-galactopyranose mutase [Nocardioidaceae bacterium]